MSTFITFRCLSKSLKRSSPLQNCVNPLKYKLNAILAAQNYATKSKLSTSNATGTIKDEWRTIYKLPLIPLASAFNRVKIPYGILNALVIPVTFALEQSSQFPPSTAMLVSAVGLTSLCTLAITSMFVRNLVGFVYVNDNNDKLKLAYVDYWGKRHDMCMDFDDVIPESEQSKPSKFDFYRSVCLHSDKTVKYKLLTRFGKIEERDTFVAIFGE